MDKVRRIELLVRAADTGSFAKAARSLDLTPSAVSHAIAELEKELRVPMFHRTTRQLRLTEDGEAVYRRGRDILRQLAELDNDVHRAPERLTGTLRVGLPMALSQSVIMPALSGFVRRYRNLQLHFHVQTQPKEMHAEGMDILLRIGNPPESGLIAAVVAGAGFMRAGCFDPSLVASGQLRRVLADWSCLGGFYIYAMFRKSPRMPLKLAAFLGFVAEAFTAFDPDEVTLVHDRSFGEWLRRMPHLRH